MNIEKRPISEITRRATDILFKEMGIVDTIRFLNQFSMGRGDYTQDREQWLGHLTMDEIITEIKAERDKQ